VIGATAIIVREVKENQIANVVGIPNMKNKKPQISPMRIPLPKQRNQVFRTKKDYNRKDKSWQDSRDFSFL